MSNRNLYRYRYRYQSLGARVAREGLKADQNRRDQSGDFDDMGNSAFVEAYHTHRLARRGLLNC